MWYIIPCKATRKEKIRQGQRGHRKTHRKSWEENDDTLRSKTKLAASPDVEDAQDAPTAEIVIEHIEAVSGRTYCTGFGKSDIHMEYYGKQTTTISRQIKRFFCHSFLYWKIWPFWHPWGGSPNRSGTASTAWHIQWCLSTHDGRVHHNDHGIHRGVEVPWTDPSFGPIHNTCNFHHFYLKIIWNEVRGSGRIGGSYVWGMLRKVKERNGDRGYQLPSLPGLAAFAKA